jgi:hypothetical protein
MDNNSLFKWRIVTFLFALAAFMAFPPFARAATLPPLKVKGNHLEASGRPVTLRGVSLCSLSWQDAKQDIMTLTDSPTAWHPSVIRLPVQPREWSRNSNESYLRDRLDPAVAACKAANVYCIIDWHAIGDWNDPKQQQALQQFWALAAPRYANEPNILYEIFNEPVEPKDKTLENWQAYRSTAQAWVDTIRAAAPNTILLIGTPFWDQMPSFAATAPFKGDNLAYVLHLYPNYKPGTYDDLFGKASAQIPLFITEWGWSSSLGSITTEFHGTEDGYAKPLQAYLDQRPQINWTAWSYDKSCGPAMLGQDQDMGTFVKAWLGKYAGNVR